MNAVNTVLKKHWRLLVFILGLIFVFCFLWILRTVFMPFIVGFILAYMLLPLIRWIEKRLPGTGRKTQMKRISIIAGIYILALVIIGLIVFYIIAVMGKSLVAMIQDVPQMIPNGLESLTNWLKSLAIFSSPSIQLQIDKYSVQVGQALGQAVESLLSGGWDILKSSSGMILGFAIMPIFTFYILKDWGRLRDRFYLALPLWSRTYTRNVFSILQNVVGRYLRGQLILGLVVGACAFILLMVLRIQFALPLAVFAGITELVPMIGPWLGGGLAVLVTLATTPDKAIWVGIGYIVIQLLENNLLVPKIQGAQMQIHPAFIIILSVLGAYFAGILGFIIILPLTMIILGMFKYFRESVRESETHVKCRIRNQ